MSAFLSVSARALAPFRLGLPAAGVLAVRAAPVRHIGATASALPARMRRPEWVEWVQTRRITTSAPLRSEVKDTEEALRDLGDLFGEARMEIEDAHDSVGTTYYNDDVELCQELVDEVLTGYKDIIDNLAATGADSEANNVRQTWGLKLEQLKGEMTQLLDADDH